MTKKVFNKAASLLNLMFDYAIEQEIIQTNITSPSTKKLVFKPATDNSDIVCKPEQRDKLFAHVKALPQTRYTLVVRLMACFPLRIGELRALNHPDGGALPETCSR